MRNGWLWLVVMMIGCSVMGSFPAQAEAETGAGKRQVLLVLVNRLTPEDAAQMPHLQALAARGATGWMNGATRGDAAGYATMALGAPTPLEEAALQVRMAGETEEARPWTGQKVGSGVSVVSWGPLLVQHKQREFAVPFGSAGQRLENQGLETAVFGSSDRGRERWRPSVLFTMNEAGWTPLGSVADDLLVKDAERPFGVRTRYQALWNGYEAVRQRAALVVFDLADLYRLDAYGEQLTPERRAELRQTTLREIDAFVHQVRGAAGADTLLVVAVPSLEGETAHLAPLVMAGADVAPGSVLTSATTRRAGVVSSVDVMPTVLEFLGAGTAPGMIGYPLRGSAALGQPMLEAARAGAEWAYLHRPGVLTGVGVLCGVALLLALWKLVFDGRIGGGLVRGLLWVALALPTCLLIAPLLRPSGIWELLGGVVALLLLLVAIPFRTYCLSLRSRLVWLGMWTVGAVLVDTGLGGLLARQSLLSYDPIVGARYYGIGNEFMGATLGAAVLIAAAWLLPRGHGVQAQGDVQGLSRPASRWRSVLVTLAALGCGVLLTVFFASPIMGTNTGGALTAAAVTAFCVAQVQGWGFWRTGVLVAAGVMTACLLLVALNTRTENASHIGMATHLVLTGGAEEVLRMLARKTDMVVRLFTITIWPTVLLGALVLYAAFLFSARTATSRWFRRSAAFWRVQRGLLLGAVVGLVTNDSGVVVAAMMLLFALYPALLLALEPEREATQDLRRMRAA